ncbi:MAG: hypothetical protein ABR570_00010 [Burkholderiales bacterium]
MKRLKPLPHGILDYGLAVVFLIAPLAFGFESEAARSLSRAIGVLYIVASFVTRYPLGGLKLIPFPVHGVLETIAALSWIAMPFLFGFADDAAARNFFIIAAVALLGVVTITDYRGAERFGATERRTGETDRRQQRVYVTFERRVAAVPRRRGGRLAAQL